jgi:hypothetical protein
MKAFGVIEHERALEVKIWLGMVVKFEKFDGKSHKVSQLSRRDNDFE